VAEQPRREFPPTILTTRAGHATVQKDAHPSEIQRRPCPGPQPFQPRTSSRQPRHLQSTTLRRIGGVAGGHGLSPSPVWHSCAQRRQVTVRLTAPVNRRRVAIRPTSPDAVLAPYRMHAIRREACGTQAGCAARCSDGYDRAPTATSLKYIAPEPE
jgi:hypothetical protein